MRSATTTAGTFVLARGTTGISEQSATTTPSRPCSLPGPSHTASGSSARPIEHVADGVVVVDVRPADRSDEVGLAPGRELGPDQRAQRLGRSELAGALDPFDEHGEIVSVGVGQVPVVHHGRRARDRRSRASDDPASAAPSRRRRASRGPRGGCARGRRPGTGAGRTGRSHGWSGACRASAPRARSASRRTRASALRSASEPANSSSTSGWSWRFRPTPGSESGHA